MIPIDVLLLAGLLVQCWMLARLVVVLRELIDAVRWHARALWIPVEEEEP